MRILTYILFCMMVYSCKNIISEEMHNMQKQKIDISVLRNEIDSINKENYKYILYYDSTDCSSCAIKELWRWDDIVEEFKQYNVDFYAILSASSTSKTDLKYLAKATRTKLKVIIDSCNVFANNNPHLSDDRILHCFLLNKSDSIILFGNPLSNKMVNELLSDIVKHNDVTHN